jgi:hypothetical protein
MPFFAEVTCETSPYLKLTPGLSTNDRDWNVVSSLEDTNNILMDNSAVSCPVSSQVYYLPMFKKVQVGGMLGWLYFTTII